MVVKSRQCCFPGSIVRWEISDHLGVKIQNSKRAIKPEDRTLQKWINSSRAKASYEQERPSVWTIWGQDNRIQTKNIKQQEQDFISWEINRVCLGKNKQSCEKAWMIWVTLLLWDKYTNTNECLPAVSSKRPKQLNTSHKILASWVRERKAKNIKLLRSLMPVLTQRRMSLCLFMHSPPKRRRLLSKILLN